MGLTEIPAQFADYFTINETTAQLILSVAVIMAILLPVMYLTREKNAPTIWLVVLFFGECIVLGLGWAPFFIMVITIGLTALSIAALGAKATTGG